MESRHLSGALGQQASRPLRAQLATGNIGTGHIPPIGNILPRPRTRAEFPHAPRPPHRERPRLSRPNTSPSRPFGEAALSPLHQPTNYPIHGFKQPNGQTTTSSSYVYPRSAPVNAAAFVKVVSIRSIRALMKSPLYPRVA